MPSYGNARHLSVPAYNRDTQTATDETINI